MEVKFSPGETEVPALISKEECWTTQRVLDSKVVPVPNVTEEMALRLGKQFAATSDDVQRKLAGLCVFVWALNRQSSTRPLQSEIEKYYGCTHIAVAPHIVRALVLGLKMDIGIFDKTLYQKIRQQSCDYDLILANLFPAYVVEASDSIRGGELNEPTTALEASIY